MGHMSQIEQLVLDQQVLDQHGTHLSATTGHIWDTCPRYSSECNSSPLFQAPHRARNINVNGFPWPPWPAGVYLSGTHLNTSRRALPKRDIYHIRRSGTYIIYVSSEQWDMYGTYTGHMSKILISTLPGAQRTRFWNLVRYLEKRRQFNAMP
jgi:hypothetical protein